jgi:hypothetical protein
LAVLTAALAIAANGVAVSAGAPTLNADAGSGDRTWDVEHSPYVLRRDVIVRRGSTLTIQPGVQVHAHPGVALIVRGVLRVEGTVTDPVVFRGASPPQRWEGIRFVGTAGMRREDSRSAIAFAELRNARAAVAATYDSPALSDVTFTRNRRGVELTMPATNVELQRVQFFRNDVALSGHTAAKVSVGGSDFYDNRRTLVAGPKRPYDCVRDDGVWAVHGNDILRGPDDGWYSNDVAAAPGSYHAYDAGFRVDLRYNYWNTLKENDIRARILDAAEWEESWDDGLRTSVLWDPFSPAPLTPWMPPGQVAQPSIVPHSHPHPAVYSFVTSPVDTGCLPAGDVSKISGFGVQQFAKIAWMDVAVKRLRRDIGCSWLADRGASLRRRSCARPVWLRAGGEPDGMRYTYRLPLSRSLPPGRYVAYSRSMIRLRDGRVLVGEPGMELARNKVRFRIR